ncbi:MAG: hypothetical protein FVQ79_12950 [Planctomycetes bacterium]|nr:hypothetical protein [Planctomycetota bacterium]
MDTTPKPPFLRGLQNQKWTVAGAISELIDNSLGSGRGNARHVWIEHDVTNRRITVSDDGRGMDHIGRLFQLGNTIGRSVGDIGEYGSGGTMAILWLSSVVEIYTLLNGRLAKHRRDWREQLKADTFFSVSDEWVKATPANTPIGLWEAGHGTLIICHLRRERQFLEANVIRDLQNNYAPGIRNGKQIVWKTIRKGRLSDSRALSEPYLELTDSISFDFVLDTGKAYLGVMGRAGIVDDLSYAQSRMAIGYAHRIICRTRDCYQNEAGERFSGTGVCGWIDLGEGWQPYLSTTKNSIDDDRIYQVLMNHLFDELRPLLSKIDDKTLNVIFNGLELSVQDSLNDLSSLKVKDIREAVPLHVVYPPGVNPPTPAAEPLAPGPTVEIKHQVAGPDEGPDVEIETCAQCEIIVVQLSNKEMNGILCMASVVRNDVIVQVNKDHPYVEEAVKAKPPKREAIIYMIVREMAVSIAGEITLQKKIFPAKIFKLLQEMEDSEKERHITRFLVDRAS